MSKKNLLIILSIIIIIGIILFLYYTKINNTVEKRDYFAGISIDSGHISDKEDINKIISSRAKLEEYCNKYIENEYANSQANKAVDKLLNVYDKKFFKKQSLAIIFVELSSGSACVQFTKATRDKNNVIIEYNTVDPGPGKAGTCDMSGGLIVVGIDKDIKNISTIGTKTYY